MRINHNIAALNAWRGMTQTDSALGKSLEKLSSGLRINRAGDDAAGLAISEKMRGQIRGLNMASKNAQDGISLVQTAEGALSETHSILQRMRELAVQASNDTNADNDRAEIQKEIDQLTTEINRIGNTTEFNTKKLINGDVSVTDKFSSYAQGTDEMAVATTILDADTKANALTTSLNASIEIHAASGAAVKASGVGAPTLTDADLNVGNVVIGAANNELTLSVNGVTKHVVLTSGTYDGSGGNGAADLIDDLNAAFLGAGTGVTASIDADTNKLVLTTNTTGSSRSISILGSGAASTLFGVNFESTNIAVAGKDDNTQFTMDIGADNNIAVTLTTGTYTLADMAAHLETQIELVAVDNVAVTVEGSRLKIENEAAGASHQIGDFQGQGAITLGLTDATITAAQDANNTLKFTIDGETDVDVTLDAGTYDRTTLATLLQTKINADSAVAKDVVVEVTSGNVLKITSGEEGSTGSVVVVASEGSDTLGLTSDASTNNTGTAGSDGTASDMKMQVGANNGQLMSLNISDMRSAALQIAGTANTSQGVVANARFTTANTVSNGTDVTLTQGSLDVSTVETASAAIEVIDKAITSVSAERSKLGAFQNRLEHTINNLGASSENLTAAESRIRDVDMAAEMMEFTKQNILAQAGTAMLAQANQRPQQVLQLLQ